MKIKPITLIVAVYGGLVLIGLAIGSAGALLKRQSMTKAGLIILITGAIIGLIPLVSAVAYRLWRRFRANPARKV